MWAGFAESYGVVVHRVAADWTRDIDLAELETAFADHPQARAVTVAYTDSSTGVANDVAAVARIANQYGALTLVDGVSSIGGMPFEMDAWGVDVAVTASQKCLMSSPGISFAVLSERAMHATATSNFPKNYWDFRAIEQIITKPKPETPGTTPVHLALQVAEALRMIHEEGLKHVFCRHTAMSDRARRGAADLGLTLQCPAFARQSATMTALAFPTPGRVREGLKARGILTAAGLGRFQPDGFRIGHMGDIRLDDVDRTLDALRDVLARSA